MGEKADWKGVGDSLRTLGDKLSRHATDGSDRVKAASNQAGSGVGDQLKAGGQAAVDKFDETTRDPEVTGALKDVTNRFLDAVKIQLTGGDTADDPAPSAPKPVDPPQEG